MKGIEDAQTESATTILPAARATPVMPEQSQPVAHQGACGKLSSALAMARDKCKAASKDGYNAFHKYAYASADEVILTAKAALEGTGLAIIPQVQELTTLGDGNAAIYALNRTIFLSHSSGEFVPLSIRGWPVVPEKGRPLDKAFAVALTTSLSYLLRDLLQMPRGDDADMNSRDDTKHTPEARPAAQPAVNGDLAALRNELGNLIREVAGMRHIEPDDGFAKLRNSMFHKFPDLPLTTSEWERAELLSGIDLMKRAKGAKSPPVAPVTPPEAERYPGQDDEDEQCPDPTPGTTTVGRSASNAAKTTIAASAPASSSATATANKAATIEPPSEWELARDDMLSAMKSGSKKWPDLIKVSGTVIGRPLAKGAMVADLHTEDLRKLTAYCRGAKAVPA